MLINKNKVIKNLFSLSVAEFFNKGIVFITNAYLARVILPQGNGMIGIANTINVYFLLFVTLGFNTVGTREIAKNNEQIPAYVNSIVTLRFLLAIVAFAAFTAFVMLYNLNDYTKLVVWICGFNLFSNAFLLDWVYQGIEKMEVIAIRQMVTGIVNLIGVLLLVHSINNTHIAMIVNVLATYINSFWMFALYLKNYKNFKFKLDGAILKPLIKSSINISFYTFFVTVLNTVNVLIINSYYNESVTGIYYAALKISLFAIIPSNIVQGAFFPILSKAQTLEDRRQVMKKYSIIMYVLGIIVCVAIIYFSDFVVNVIYGSHFAAASVSLKVLMIAAIMIYINTSITPPLLAFNREKHVMIAIGIASCVCVAANLIMVPMFGPIGAAYSSVLTELSVAIGLSFSLYKCIQASYVKYLLILVLFAVIACTTAYFLYSIGLNIFIAIFLAVLIYAAIVIKSRIVGIDEFKTITAKFKK